jgi:hypothetical protein
VFEQHNGAAGVHRRREKAAGHGCDGAEYWRLRLERGEGGGGAYRPSETTE